MRDLLEAYRKKCKEMGLPVLEGDSTEPRVEVETVVPRDLEWVTGTTVLGPQRIAVTLIPDAQ